MKVRGLGIDREVQKVVVKTAVAKGSCQAAGQARVLSEEQNHKQSDGETQSVPLPTTPIYFFFLVIAVSFPTHHNQSTTH